MTPGGCPASMSQRFSRDVRLCTGAEFSAVRDRGRRVATRHMTLLAIPNVLERDRLGIIASRRLGGAVVRNRAKRRLREVFRLTEPDRAADRGAGTLDVVVIPRRELIDAPFTVLRTEFAAALRRLHGAR